MLDKNAISLQDQVAVITGGGAGFGRAIALAFVNCGARVVIADNKAENIEKTLALIAQSPVEGKGECRGVLADVRIQADVDRLAQEVKTEYGHVDILVNNVGDFLGFVKPFMDSTEEEWDAAYDTNLKQIFRVTRAIGPLLDVTGNGGSIINISTIEAFRAMPKISLYSAFKAAITAFTKTLAIELGSKKIRVNTVAPETSDTDQVPLDYMLKKEHVQYLPYLTPLGRFGTPDDMAGCVLFLASKLSAWVTGTVVHMDGGALAAGGFYRVVGTDQWTNMPIVKEGAMAL